MGNMQVYRDCLQSELIGHRLRVDEEIITSIAEETSLKISTLNATDCLLEFSPDNSLKYTLLFPGGRTLMIHKPLVPDEIEVNDIVYSFFIDKKLISADVNDIDAFIKGFKTYLV